MKWWCFSCSYCIVSSEKSQGSLRTRPPKQPPPPRQNHQTNWQKTGAALPSQQQTGALQTKGTIYGQKRNQDLQKRAHCILPESCIEFPLTSDSSPQAYCKNYGDISLRSPEEPPREGALYKTDQYCPEYFFRIKNSEITDLSRLARRRKRRRVKHGADCFRPERSEAIYRNRIRRRSALKIHTPQYGKFFNDLPAGWRHADAPPRTSDERNNYMIKFYLIRSLGQSTPTALLKNQFQQH